MRKKRLAKPSLSFKFSVVHLKQTGDVTKSQLVDGIPIGFEISFFDSASSPTSSQAN